MSGGHAQRRRAFTIMEAVVALVILGVAMPGMLVALRQAHIDRVSPVMASRARWLAIERMEDVIADRASPARGYAYIVNGNYGDEDPVAGDTAYARSVTIVETGPDFQAGTGVKAVTVTVSWSHRSGQDHEIAFSTVVTELP